MLHSSWITRSTEEEAQTEIEIDADSGVNSAIVLQIKSAGESWTDLNSFSNKETSQTHTMPRNNLPGSSTFTVKPHKAGCAVVLISGGGECECVRVCVCMCAAA